MKIKGWALQDAWMTKLADWLALCPMSETNPGGVAAVGSLLATELDHLGFTVHRIQNPSGREGSTVLAAVRSPSPGVRTWVGLCGHWDVETTSPLEWASDPLVPTIRDRRVYCRGVGDNLGPLLQRLLVLASMPEDAPCPGLFWVLHGEEETGNGFPHQVFPTLYAKFPNLKDSIALWMDETGYFEANGDQRLLVVQNHNRDLMRKVVVAVETSAHADNGGRQVHVVERFLNKELGGKTCPYRRFLFGPQVDYVALGMNDVLTNIHRPNESVPLDTLAVSATQFAKVLAVVAAHNEDSQVVMPATVG
ncbi:hypothetical protein DYB35_003367 [Aphanomyces astaci]|uniref:Peptidase M20 dimerisation domain-containing protein n=1 Tax=Aphanomyces astaci TaxID=112090 RepID=A0A418DXA4_APHAT|nr:hypothetical protein DYB35_003367 [Aphanomyces astaci]